MDIAPRVGLSHELSVRVKIFDLSSKYGFLLGIQTMKNVGMKIDLKKQEFNIKGDY